MLSNYDTNSLVAYFHDLFTALLNFFHDIDAYLHNDSGESYDPDYGDNVGSQFLGGLFNKE